MNDAELEKKLATNPDPCFKGWRFEAWKRDFRNWSRDWDIVEMKTEAIVKRFEYASRLIQQGMWGEGKI